MVCLSAGDRRVDGVEGLVDISAAAQHQGEKEMERRGSDHGGHCREEAAGWNNLDYRLGLVGCFSGTASGIAGFDVEKGIGGFVLRGGICGRLWQVWAGGTGWHMGSFCGFRLDGAPWCALKANR